ncbi:MAG TPA: hypothetical protein VLA16_03570 [Ideonella sp.]|nr:hypothetical protein [Ideonella sp.]
MKILMLALACLLSAPARANVNVPDCGAEYQRSCAWTDQEYYDMGFRSCEYDLKDSSDFCVNEKRRIWNRRDAWQEWALKQQRYAISAGEPINWVPTIGAHNAFSSTHQGFGGEQSNQTYSISDSLTMGVRYLEIDPHWSGGKMLVCHNGIDPCLPAFTRPLANVFAEIRNWLNDNPGEVIFVKLDDRVGGNYTDLTALISIYFGDKAYLRPADPSAWPTIAQVRSAGKQILFGSRNNQIPDGNWIWYFTETYATTNDHPEDFTLATCTDGDSSPVATRSKGRWSVVAEGRSFSNWGDQTGLVNSRTEVANYLKCGVGVLALDFLDALGDPVIPEFQRISLDERIAGSAWSFDLGDYGLAGPAMLLSGSGRWQSRDPSEFHAYACQLSTSSFYDRKFVVTSSMGPWNNGDAACKAQFPGSRFSAPTLPQFNETVRAAAAVLGTDTWLNFTVLPQPDPTVSPSAVQFVANIGAVPKESQQVVIYGRPGKSLVAKSNDAWVKVKFSGGKTAREQGNPILLTIAASAKSFAAGDYSTTVAVGYLGEGASNSIRVDYRVLSQGVGSLSLSPASVRQPGAVTAVVSLSAGSSPLPLSGGEVLLREVIPDSAGGAPMLITRATKPLTTPGPTAQVSFTLDSLSLAQGSHRLFSTYSGGSNFTAFDTDTRVLEVLPRIVVSPTAMSFTMPAGGPLPASQLLKVGASNGPTSAAKFPTWAGAVAQGTDYLVQIGSSALGFAAGAYTGSFIVTDTHPGEAEVPLSLVVQSPLQIAPKSAALTAASQPVSTGFEVQNGDGRPLKATASASWLTVQLSQNVAPAGAIVTANPVGLAAGLYEGQVTVRSAWAAKGAVFKVKLTVAP